jgi:hypothetical protein
VPVFWHETVCRVPDTRFLRLCETLVRMRTPELRIVETIDGIPTQGTCSICRDVIFTAASIIGTLEDNQLALEQLFSEHFSKVHLHEAFS